MSIESRSNQYGKIFDHWQIKEFLGQGSGGKTAVFRLVRSDSSQGTSALKIINLIEEQGDRERFSPYHRSEYEKACRECSERALQEVNLMEKLAGNTNIVDYKDHTFVDWSDDNSFGRDMLIRMELLEDLRTQLRKGKRLTEEEILKLGRDICTALVLCHSQNILHRDIKPENIFVNANGNYKLGDFGVSRIINAAPMSKASTNVGTPEYAAPEQFNGGHDMRGDIYSLGLVLYELSNRNCQPFASSSYARPEEIQKRHLGMPLPAPSEASPGLAKVILKACSFRPEDRYQSAQEFLDALNRVGKTSFTFTNVTVNDQKTASLNETVLDSGDLNATVYSYDSRNRNATAYAGGGSPNIHSTVYAKDDGADAVDRYIDNRYVREVSGSNERAGYGGGNAGGNNQSNQRLPWIIAIVAVLVALLALMPNLVGGKDSEDPEEDKQVEATQTEAVQETKPPALIQTEAPTEPEPAVPEYGMVEAGDMHSVQLMEDGTVRAADANHFCDGDNVNGRCDVYAWRDIVKISACNHTVGLKSDGTVLAIGYNNCGQCDVYGWSDIIDISAGSFHTLGLRSDGTVVAVGLNEDGQCDVYGWTDIIAVVAGHKASYGLRSDGTVVMAGKGQKAVSAWRNVVQISAGYTSVAGLQSDGTVVCAGLSEEGKAKLSNWSNVKEISTGNVHTVALLENGTVIAHGNNDYGQCDVYGWSNIVDVSAGMIHTVGLRADGTVVATGSNQNGQCDIRG